MSRLAYVLVTAWFVTAPLMAQAPAAPHAVEPPFVFVESTIREARAGQQGAIEDFYLKLRAAEAKLQVPGLTDIYVLEHGGAGLRYRSFRSLRSWAGLDTRLQDVTLDTLTRAYGEAEQRRLVAALQAATASVTTEVLRVIPGRSTWRNNGGQAWPYVEVRRTKVRPERVAQHDDFQERIRAVRASAGAAPEVRFQIMLGEGFVFVTTRYFRNYAERDTWQDELTKAYGEPEANRLINQWRQTLIETESLVLRHRPDLSRKR
ncbi:MAG: hypothetical protein OEW19_07595 [Acidobacteriota bacterium]|nr:hypothetical protein [Acidobacteriota bacterium]